jgi:hypothetical protein
MDRTEIQNPKALRLFVRAPKLGRGQDCGEVDEGAGDRRDGDAVDRRAIAWMEVARLVDCDAPPGAGAAWDRDVDRGSIGGAKTVEGRGVAMAQDSVWPEGKYGSHPPGALR